MISDFKQKTNNTRAIKNHTVHIEQILLAKTVTESDRANHLVQISFLQNERIAHLHTLLGTLITTILTLILCTISPSVQTFALFALFLGLTIPYVVHYLFLENSIQHWYELYRLMLPDQND